MSKETKSVFSIEPAEVFLASKGLTPAMFEMESIFLHFGQYGYNNYHRWAYDVLKQKGYGFCGCREFPKCSASGEYSPPIKIDFLFPKENFFFWTMATKVLEKLTAEYEFIVSVKETLLTNQYGGVEQATLKATGLRRKVKAH